MTTRKKAPRSTVVSDAQQMAMLSHPTRFAIHQAIAWGGATTIREVSERIGMKPASLYRHVEALCEAGIVEEDEIVETGRRPARTYRARQTFSLEESSPETMEALCRIAERGSKYAAQAFRRHAESGDACTRGPQRDLQYSARSGWLDADDLARANELINELRTMFRDAPPADGRKLVHLSLLVSSRSDAVPAGPTASRT